MNYRKASVVSDVTRTTEGLPSIVTKLQITSLWTPTDSLYPFSQVLRLRVLQIVCGICILLMGSVSCIEDRTSITRLGLGIPAGVFTVIAAGGSIHSSRGFGGYRPGSCPYTSLRFLGPSPAAATSLTLLWLAACSLHVALIFQALFQLQNTDNSRTTQTSILVAVVEMILSVTTLIAVLWVVRIDCCYDPD
ncbi:uncharacterized protein LOC128997728 [Macrosteles quadrilineatus]|uniref:uncharacterized protein LOC128997728 n=1 Tax=Macrosteles quadrilineatus TaxID=74068 RepID=UPI0023E33C52|nr:uncharacterized protein LOC128997728 [Macrosteles quadrilineatus]